MFDVGLQELVVILVIALLVFGPSKLPEVGRMIGRALRELRRMNDEFRSTVNTTLETNGTELGVPVLGSTSVGAGRNDAVATSLDGVPAVAGVSDAVCAASLTKTVSRSARRTAHGCSTDAVVSG